MPPAKRLAVANTTPIIALAMIGKLDVLQQLYSEVVIPTAVQLEILAGGISNIGVAELQKCPWIQATALQDPGRADLLADLDRGEAEAIALALELKADLLIIDERLARRHARRLGLKLTGTLGVLLEAKRQGFVPAVKPLVDRLLQGGIRLSDSLVAQVLVLAGEN